MTETTTAPAAVAVAATKPPPPPPSSRPKAAPRRPILDAEGSDLLRPSRWPAAAPHAEASHVMSVVCGNSRLHWAIHEGPDADYFPSLFWKTSAPGKGGQRLGCGMDLLTKYFPVKAARQLFDLNDDADAAGPSAKDGESWPDFSAQEFGACEKAWRENSRYRRIPYLDVYILSTNDEMLKETCRLVYLISSNFRPCRLWQLAATDFFDRRCFYPGMGVDRLAILCAAEGLYGRPSLVLDGGTAMTYTATGLEEVATESSSVDGEPSSAVRTTKVLGGGIAPGIGARFNSLHSQTGALPCYDYYDIRRRIRECLPPNGGGRVAEEKKEDDDDEAREPKLALFANNTKDSMMGCVLREVQTHMTKVVSAWRKTSRKALQDKVPAESPNAAEAAAGQLTGTEATKTGRPKWNTNCTVCITGGDGDYLEDLLTPDIHSQFLESFPDEPRGETFDLAKHKHLIHQGVADVLCKQRDSDEARLKVETQSKSPYFLRNELLGQRVVLPLPPAKGKPGANRREPDYGTIVYALPPAGVDEETDEPTFEDMYQIRLDNGARQDLDIEEVYDALLLYSENAENGLTQTSAPVAKLRKEQCSKAKQVVALMQEIVPVVVDRLERERKEAAATKKSREEAASAKKKREQAAAAGNPPAKKARKEGGGWTVAKVEANPKALIEMKVAKPFGQEVYIGVVHAFNPYKENEDEADDEKIDLWHIIYEDGDREDFDSSEMAEYLNLYAETGGA